MKNFKYLFLALMITVSCTKDDDGLTATDIVHEFVFLPTTALSMNELTNSSNGNEIEIHAEMLAIPRNEDLVISLTVTGDNTESGVDFEIVSPEQTIVIPAGAYVSTEGFKLRTIDNNLPSTEDRKINISIASVSDPAIKIGKGINNPTNTLSVVSITDDECSDPISIFNNAEWSLTGSNPNDGDYTGSFTTTLSGNVLSIIGDIANYDVGITAITTLTPDAEKPTTGTITFDSSTEGMDDWGYTYRWVITDQGSYDICGRSIQLSATLQYIDINGPDPTAWVDWYTATITATMTTEGSEGASPPSGSVVATVSAMAGEQFSLSGSISDNQGLSSISLQHTGLSIDQNIPLSGEMTYDLNEVFTVPAGTADGDYSIEVIATNIENLSSTFHTVLTVSSPTECTDDYTVFGGVSLNANASVTETDGSFDPYDFSKEVSTTLSGDQLIITGDIIDFFDTQLTVTMVPNSEDPTIGTVSFTEESLGTHSDGFTYHLVQEQEGTYDACEGTMTLYYNIEYDDGAGNWVPYYKLQTEFLLN